MNKRVWFYSAALVALIILVLGTMCFLRPPSATLPEGASAKALIDLSFQTATYNQVQAFISNDDKDPATVSSLVLSVTRSGLLETYTLYPHGFQKGLGQQVAPHNDRAIVFDYDGLPVPGIKQTDACKLTLHAIDFQSHELAITKNVDCGRFNIFDGSKGR